MSTENIPKELTAEEILHKNYIESIKGMESISTNRFPGAYNESAINAMEEYASLKLQQANKEIESINNDVKHWQELYYEEGTKRVLRDKELFDLQQKASSDYFDLQNKLKSKDAMLEEMANVIKEYLSAMPLEVNYSKILMKRCLTKYENSK